MRGADALAERLGNDLLLSLSGTAVRNVPVGEDFLSYVDGTVRHVLKDIQPPPTGHMVTIPSLRGTVVFTVKNGTRYQTKIVVKLVPHGQLTLPEGDQITEVLQPGESRLVQMAVQAQTTGRFPITVQILAPEGGLIAQSQLIVRSTAYNRLALFVTAGAVLFLLLWWGRRFLPHAPSPQRRSRRRTPRPRKPRDRRDGGDRPPNGGHVGRARRSPGSPASSASSRSRGPSASRASPTPTTSRTRRRTSSTTWCSGASCRRSSSPCSSSGSRRGAGTRHGSPRARS